MVCFPKITELKDILQRPSSSSYSLSHRVRLHSRCCHFRAHAFARYVTASGSSSVTDRPVVGSGGM